MMNKVYLPTLKKISVTDFSLYPNALNLEYEFINGVNLIIGGNGTGKTTFINLIKYALVGLYKKQLDVRIYKGEKREIRYQYSNSYFRNRMDKEYHNNENAQVTLEFEINNTTFIVTRDIHDIILKQVKIINDTTNEEYLLPGNVIKQEHYERLDKKEKTNCLQFKYEQMIKEKTNLSSFDDFILFVNEVLLFDERRKTILWDFDFQTRILHKYFSDPELNAKYEDLLRKEKYYDSLARHKSEDARAIRNIIEDIEKKIDRKNDKDELISEIAKIENNIDRIISKMNNINNNRKETQNRLMIAFSQRNSNGKKIKDLEKYLYQQESLLYSSIWENLNPMYDTFLSNIKHNNICPLCNKKLLKETVDNIIKNNNHCMLCNQHIKNSKVKTPEIEEINEQMNELLIVKQNIEKEIYKCEKELERYDDEYTKYILEKNNKQVEFRELQNLLSANESTPSEYAIMQNQIEKLFYERDQYKNKSLNISKQIRQMEDTIDQLKINITKDLSNIFSDYGEKFLGLSCYLSYTDLGSNKNYKSGEERSYKYIPYIADKPRLEPEELSESQRFFIDHSFRMSLLEYFYINPTFFICETPESSLDISYERNAADIFLNYLKRPNALILTSNLNNSDFLDYIIDNSNNVNCINLLKIGKQTKIQSTSHELIKISDRIEEKINAKRKNI